MRENGNTENLKDGQRLQLEKYSGLNINGYEFTIEDSYIKHAFQAVRSFVDAVDKENGKVVKRVHQAESSAWIKHGLTTS